MIYHFNMQSQSEQRKAHDLRTNVAAKDEWHPNYAPAPPSIDLFTFNQKREMLWEEKRKREKEAMELEFGDKELRDYENI